MNDADAIEDCRVFPLEPPMFSRGMNGDIVELLDGRLLYAFAGTEIAPGAIMGCTSADSGRTWGGPATLVAAPEARFSHPDGERIVHPSLLRRQNDQLMIAYIWTVAGADPRAQTYFRLSDDEGASWSDPKVLTPSRESSVLVHNAKLLRLSTGRILAPAEVRVDMGPANDHRGWVSTAWHSDNDGHTWQRSQNEVNLLAQGVEAQEPHVAELHDGRVLMLFRTYNGCVGRSSSSDAGETWSAGELLEDLKLPSLSSALHVGRIPTTGDLLLVRSLGDGGQQLGEQPKVWNRRDGREHGIRTPLVAVISRDDGCTWENQRVIAGDPYGDYGYPSVLHLADAAVVSYHALDGLHVTRLPSAWFYAEPDAAPTT